MTNRERKRREVEEHNRRYEMEKAWRKVRPMFAYLVRLCETHQQSVERVKSRTAARAIIRETLHWAQSYGNVTPFINPYSKV